MLIEAGRDFNLMKQKVREIGDVNQACAWIEESVASGKLKPSDCSIKDFYEALDTTTFPKATGALINKTVIDAYEATPTIWQDLVTVVPSNKKNETIVGFEASETPQTVAEGMPYQDSTFGEKYVTISNLKYGRIISITEEAVMFDQTGQLLTRCKGIGEKAALKQNKLVVEGVIDLNGTVYNYMGAPTTFYSAAHGNLGSTAFGEASLEAMRVLMRDMTDENGDHILINEANMALLVPAELELDAFQMINSTLVPETAENAVNFFKGRYKIMSSPYLTSATDYYLGEFKKDFWWTEVYPLQVLSRNMQNTDEGFKRDIIAQYKTRFYGGLGAVDFRHSYRNHV